MNKLILIFSVLVTASTTSYAERFFTLSPSLIHFDYTEFSKSDKVLDRELGWLPGLEAKLDFAVTTKWIIAFNTSYHQGEVNYVGQTQSTLSNPAMPHNTDTRTNLLRLGAKIEKVVYKNINVFISAQSHRWHRDIQDNNNISGIAETYKWMEYSIGLNSNFHFNKNDVLNLEAGFLITRNGTIDVDLSRVDYGSTKLNLGDSAGIRLKLFWRKQYKENIHYGPGLFFESWEFGRSNTKQTQGGSSSTFVTEPRSETRNIGLTFNVEYSF